MEDTTVVFLTDHPLSLQTASRVIVLKDGSVIESGSHQELLR